MESCGKVNTYPIVLPPFSLYIFHVSVDQTT
jgi:hypothetical protein